MTVTDFGAFDMCGQKVFWKRATKIARISNHDALRIAACSIEVNAAHDVRHTSLDARHFPGLPCP
jgi:hypothetical protein